ncbi:MAG: metalloprotease PmbA [Betaproteobacteria bacterium]|nr:metalloprotease PmbA [Betaproteobacteria bacterium]
MFAYTPDQFRQLCADVLRLAQRQGASQAAVEVSEGYGLSVGTRMSEVEKIEHHRDKSLGVTVYLGQRRGNASTSDLSPAALQATVQAAYDIARYTAEDDCAGLPEPELLEHAPPDLDLLHPWMPAVDDAVALARRMEDAAFATDRRITNSEGAGVSAQQSHFMAANSAGFSGGYGYSRHTLSCTPIAGRGNDMHVDNWYSSTRAAADLAAPEAIGRYAAERALSRMKARRLGTLRCPVLFEAPLAAGLLGAYVQATSGGALYRKASFLTDSLGQMTWADHVSVHEDPHQPKGRGSAPFDDEGVRTAARTVVDAGRTQGYFLSCYTARKLGMRSTGNGGGSHNLRVVSSRTQPGDDLPAMLRKLHRGLFVVDLMGQGVNTVTGDYSRGAFGFWVEGGEIAYPVHEITIAGNLRDMLRGVQAVGADAYTYGSKTTGSILVNEMTVAGN